MDIAAADSPDWPNLENALGYLNFSSGATDPQFLQSINELFARIESADNLDQSRSLWLSVGAELRDALQQVQGTSAAFSDCEQARAVIDLTIDHAVPGYLNFHRDLLFHQDENSLIRPLMFARFCEAVLACGPPWDEADRITESTINRLNDFLGHRPVAALETQKLEPYVHERVRPIPLYVRGVGVAHGASHDLLERALEILGECDQTILETAHFEIERLQELAVDPRACDFDHPAGKRPNYYFGQWDPHQIDNQGFFYRFVLQQITLDALLQRVDQGLNDIPRDQLMREAAGVLAGTILMASGISGRGPGAHDSTVSLANLLPRVAAYRDEFYSQLLQTISGEHGRRLREEASVRQQPFGGARQHLNAQLARRRATQIERVYLAKIFARMGYSAAAARQADVVPVASARMLCRIDCRLTEGHQVVAAGNRERATELLEEIMDLLHRAIHCGAVIDPWNILGFDGNYSLFPALENTVRDERADELIVLMEQIFALYSRVWGEAAAQDNQAVAEQVRSAFERSAQWWHQFAVHEVSSVDGFHAMDVYHAAEHVARALGLWYQDGAAAGDTRFWAPHVELFDSPKAYAMVIEALLERRDHVASMALLVHWLSQADRVSLKKGDTSFHELAERWLGQLQQSPADQLAGIEQSPDAVQTEAEGNWSLARKFFDYMEANAGEYWDVPSFDIGQNGHSRLTAADELLDDEALDDDDSFDDELYGAAYEDVVYRDSTDDGIEGEVFEEGEASEDELEEMSHHVTARLAFLSGMARLWNMAARPSEMLQCDPQGRVETLRRWLDRAIANRQALMELLAEIHNYRVPAPNGDHDSMIRYDRHRMYKESLLEKTISTCVETCDAARVLLAAMVVGDQTLRDQLLEARPFDLDDDELFAVNIIAALFSGDAEIVRKHWDRLLQALKKRPLLYVPLSKGGDPRKIVRARIRQRMIEDLLAWCPRAGLIVEACELLERARMMERKQPVGPAAVTEFDALFETSFRALVESMILSAKSWSKRPGDDRLFECLERITQSLLKSWLSHSRTLRLSVLERVTAPEQWDALTDFIQRYGADLFTQRFLNMGNVRAIIHEGTDQWLQQLEQDPASDGSFRLLEELDVQVARTEAAEHLNVILEAIVENYSEYRDYNSTTTQSDRGELLYALLDFLRLRTEYDRIAWNLKPVVLAHDILVRRGRSEDAEKWRRALVEKTGDEAQRYLDRLAELRSQYAMQMPTIADRISERFVRPMAIDRIRALVEPALNEAGGDEPHTAFDLLEQEVIALAQDPTGVGFEVPAWLLALEEEVENQRTALLAHYTPSRLDERIPHRPLTYEEVMAQLDECDETE